MKISEYVNCLVEYSFKTEEVDRIVLINHEVKKNGYCYGTILNRNNSNYEVYSYVVVDSSQQIVSLLLYSLFSKFELAERYYKKLSVLLDDRDLDYLFGICKKRGQI